jgi:hypothetical protein
MATGDGARGLAVARTLALFALGVFAFLFLVLTALGLGPAAAARADVIESIRNERPEAKVEAYLRATAAGDEPAASAVWEIPDWLARQDVGPRLLERRGAVTRELATLGLGGRFTTLDVEWWRSCCEPGVIEDSREAGFARVYVSLTKPEDARLWTYVLDVVTRGGAYWGGAMGYPPREWMLVDVYRMGEQPLYWRHAR